ncbi:hypothetical protein ADL27_11510, partial [Streptomyces sp. NRRL F-6602]
PCVAVGWAGSAAPRPRLGFDGRLESNVLKFAGIGVATLFRFWSYRTWVFRAPAAVRAAKQAAEPVREPVASGTSAGRS